MLVHNTKTLLKKKQWIDHLLKLMKRIRIEILNTPFVLDLATDKTYGDRLYIQGSYRARCNKDFTVVDNWKTRKYYLSEHMTDDEIVKTCYVCFEQAMKHEIMECFKVDGKSLFNPHINFEELLKISDKEVSR
jgi:hypothetical protein